MDANPQRDELRLIQSDDGWLATVSRDNLPVLVPLIAWAVGLVLGLGLSPVTQVGPDLGALLMLVGLFAAFVAFPLNRHRVLRLRPHGVALHWRHGRAARPSPQRMLAGDDRYMLNVLPKDERFLPFSEIRDLGHTDYSLWFDLGDERVEIDLHQLSRADIARLHDELEPVWRRHRDGLQQTEEQAAAQRSRLAALQSG